MHSESSETFEAFRVEHWTRFLHQRERNPHQLRRLAFRIKKQRIRRYAPRIHPIYFSHWFVITSAARDLLLRGYGKSRFRAPTPRSEEHTSELQSLRHLV